MKHLLLMRHAKSSWKHTGLADHDRPLNARGKRDAPRMGTYLRSKELVPERILSSTAKRALKTAELVADACGYAGNIFQSRSLYAASPDEIVELLDKLPHDIGIALFVGHNPEIEELVDMLTGEAARMPTAAVAVIELPGDDWSVLDAVEDGKLVAVWRPKELWR